MSLTRLEAILWLKHNSCNFVDPQPPAPSGWMWQKWDNKLVLAPLYLVMTQGGNITHEEVKRY